MSFDGKISMPPKNLDLPGFPEVERCQLHILKCQHKWTEDELNWVKMNWIHEKEDYYVKPYSKYACLNNLKTSNDEDVELLKKVLKP